MQADFEKLNKIFVDNWTVGCGEFRFCGADLFGAAHTTIY